jgi:hypothetical protein
MYRVREASSLAINVNLFDSHNSAQLLNLVAADTAGANPASMMIASATEMVRRMTAT